MRILITNNTLAARAGSELYVRDLAISLMKKGHTPIAYSTELGEVAQEIRNATIPVIDNLNALSAVPDVIHGQHHLDTITALMHFPGVPALYFCHGWFPWEEEPPRFPRIFRYVAVDELCQERLILERGIPESRVRLLLNFVDLDRFQPRDPLPQSPARALMFSNYANDTTETVRKTCARLGIKLDLLGLGSQNASAHPEQILTQYDLVFARGRSALEALAVGAAVILLGREGCGPMVTTAEFNRLRRLNFGARALCNPINGDTLESQITRYDGCDAAMVSQTVRKVAGRDEAVDQIISLYREVIAERQARPRFDDDEEFTALSEYLRHVTPRVKAVSGLENRLCEVEAARTLLGQERDCLQLRLAAQEQATRAIEARAREAELNRDNTAAQLESVRAQLIASHQIAAAIEARAAGTELNIGNRAVQAEVARDQATAERDQLRVNLVEREQTIAALETTIQTISATAATAESQLQRMRNSLGWRLLNLYGPVKYRFVRPVYQSFRKVLSSREAATHAETAIVPAPETETRGVSKVQARANELMQQQGFMGVPLQTFEQAGRNQLIALLNQGLNPESTVLEIGCGCLRVAYWLIRFLDQDCYHGIEPARPRVDYGIRYILEPEVVKLKRPRFDHNAEFDASAFNTRFDFFLAGSIWTHASKEQIQATLDCFIRYSRPTSVFLTSYLPARSPDEDYQGDSWVGTSHTSDVPGVVRHSLRWIEATCRDRGLRVKQLPDEAFDDQTWLRIQHD